MSRGSWGNSRNIKINFHCFHLQKVSLLGAYVCLFLPDLMDSECFGWIEIEILLRRKNSYLRDSSVIQHGLTVEVVQSHVTQIFLSVIPTTCSNSHQIIFRICFLHFQNLSQKGSEGKKQVLNLFICHWWVTFWKLVEMTDFDRCYLNISDIPNILFDFDTWRGWRLNTDWLIESIKGALHGFSVVGFR